MSAEVYVYSATQYDDKEIERFLEDHCPALFDRIRPGMRVVLKPNWVRQGHWLDENDWLALITHPHVMSAVLRVTLKRLNGSGQILICDGPQTDSSFAKILARYPLTEWESLCMRAGVGLQVLDLREDEWVTKRETVIMRRKLPGDPLGSTEVNLSGPWSEFYGHKGSDKGFYGADYNISETNAAHNGEDNLYRVSRSVMTADVFINLPKLKTHLKAGITASLKNLVGINTYKNFLPHYSLGCPDEGGDQFPGVKRRQRLEAAGGKWLKQRVLTAPLLARMFSYIKPMLGRVMGADETIRSGCWHGNDTLWRMVLDLNKILFYADPDGRMDSSKQLGRTLYFSVVDAIVAGEGNGPLRPDPLVHGHLFCGDDPVVLDTVCAQSLGFDYQLIPMLKHAWDIVCFPLTASCPDDIRIFFGSTQLGLQEYKERITRFARPARGWQILSPQNVLENGCDVN